MPPRRATLPSECLFSKMPIQRAEPAHLLYFINALLSTSCASGGLSLFLLYTKARPSQRLIRHARQGYVLTRVRKLVLTPFKRQNSVQGIRADQVLYKTVYPRRSFHWVLIKADSYRLVFRPSLQTRWSFAGRRLRLRAWGNKSGSRG